MILAFIPTTAFAGGGSANSQEVAPAAENASSATSEESTPAATEETASETTEESAQGAAGAEQSEGEAVSAEATVDEASADETNGLGILSALSSFTGDTNASTAMSAEANGVSVLADTNAVTATANPDGTFKDANGIRYLITGDNAVSVISNTDDTAPFLQPGEGLGIGQATYSGIITIPETVECDGVSYSVTAINRLAFYRTDVTEVHLPASVKTIGNSAFYYCKSLTAVTLSEGLEVIESNAFEGCSTLSSMQLPSTVTSIGSAAFGACKSLTSLHIPKGVTDGLVKALVGNTLYPYLENITIEEGSPYDIEGGVLYKGPVAQLYMGSEENVVLRKGTTGLASSATGEFGNYSGIVGVFAQNKTLKSVTLPDTITSIPAYAFYSAVNMESITLPNTVTDIGDRAFYNTGLTSISLPDSVKTIGKAAFEGCINMTSVTLSSGLTSIGEEAFCDCYALTSANLPDGLINIGKYAFSETALTQLVIPKKMTTVPESAFTGIKTLKMVFIPETVENVGAKAFGSVAWSENPVTFVIVGNGSAGTAVAFDESAFGVDTVSGFDENWDWIETETPKMPTSMTLLVPAVAKDMYTAENYVLAKYINDDSFYGLDLTDSELTEKGTNTLSITVPSVATLNITSSDESIATVDAQGEVTGVSEGSAEITASITVNGFTLVSDSCTVTVGHNYGEAWESGASGHWHVCSACGKKSEVAAHTYGDWTVTKAATETEKGEKQRTCSVCGYTETAEIPAVGSTETSIETKIVQTELTEVPEGLKATSFNTVEAIENELIRVAATNEGYTADNTVVFDVKLQVSFDGGKTWTDATEDNFPKGGITVVLPYPEGTAKDTHDFVVTHMFALTSAKLGTTAGDVETPAATKLDSGIQVTLTGLSPVSISWKEVSSASASEPATPATSVDKPASTNEETKGTQAKGSESAKTGDANNIGVLIALIALATLVLVGAGVYRKKTTMGMGGIKAFGKKGKHQK